MVSALALAERTETLYLGDELKMAGKYSEQGTRLTGEVTEISFSSMADAHWNIAVDLTSSNGGVLSVDHRHDFKSGFDAITACNATADALTPAVQDLIKKVVTHPEFETLL